MKVRGRVEDKAYLEGKCLSYKDIGSEAVNWICVAQDRDKLEIKLWAR